MVAKLLLCCALSMVTLSSGALIATAQENVAPLADTAPESQGCELHVWPSNGLRSVFHGWTRGGIVDGAVTGRDGYPVVPSDPIDPARQSMLLRDADVAEKLQLRGYRVIVHDEPLESRVIRTSTARIADSSSACYAELIADDIFLQQDVVNGNFLKSSIRFRDFGGATSPQKVFGTFVQTKLAAFPPKPDRPEGNQAALDELATAYVQNLAAFGTAMNRPTKPKRK